MRKLVVMSGKYAVGLAVLALHTAPAFATEPEVANMAINCKGSGCISGGPGCDTQAVPGQCSFPKDRAVELCAAHPQCVAVNCNTARNDCQARDTRKRSPWNGMNSIVVKRTRGPFPNMAINCRGTNGCIASGPGCDTQAVPGQCSFPKDRAVEMCIEHPQCVAVNCNMQRPDCQARDWTKLEAWNGMSSIIVDKN